MVGLRGEESGEWRRGFRVMIDEVVAAGCVVGYAWDGDVVCWDMYIPLLL